MFLALGLFAIWAPSTPAHALTAASIERIPQMLRRIAYFLRTEGEAADEVLRFTKEAAAADRILLRATISARTADQGALFLASLSPILRATLEQTYSEAWIRSDTYLRVMLQRLRLLPEQQRRELLILLSYNPDAEVRGTSPVVQNYLLGTKTPPDVPLAEDLPRTRFDPKNREDARIRTMLSFPTAALRILDEFSFPRVSEVDHFADRKLLLKLFERTPPSEMGSVLFSWLWNFRQVLLENRVLAYDSMRPGHLKVLPRTTETRFDWNDYQKFSHVLAFAEEKFRTGHLNTEVQIFKARSGRAVSPAEGDLLAMAEAAANDDLTLGVLAHRIFASLREIENEIDEKLFHEIGK